MVGGGDGVRCGGQWVGSGCFLLYSGWLHMDKCVCVCVLAISGRLGVDIMTGFSCNDSFSPHRVHNHTHMHTQTNSCWNT